MKPKSSSSDSTEDPLSKAVTALQVAIATLDKDIASLQAKREKFVAALQAANGEVIVTPVADPADSQKPARKKPGPKPKNKSAAGAGPKDPRIPTGTDTGVAGTDTLDPVVVVFEQALEKIPVGTKFTISDIRQHMREIDPAVEKMMTGKIFWERVDWLVSKNQLRKTDIMDGRSLVIQKP